MKPIVLHSVPSGVYDRLNQDVIVSRLQPNGRFTDTYVADLVPGDSFHVDYRELPPRSADNIMKWVGDNQITWEWERGVPELDKDEPHIIAISKDTLYRHLYRHRYTHDDHASALREALEYVMDQDEL